MRIYLINSEILKAAHEYSACTDVLPDAHISIFQGREWNPSGFTRGPLLSCALPLLVFVKVLRSVDRFHLMVLSVQYASVMCMFLIRVLLRRFSQLFLVQNCQSYS